MELEIINVPINGSDTGAITVWVINKFASVTLKEEATLIRTQHIRYGVQWQLKRAITKKYHDYFNMIGPVDLEPLYVYVDCNEWFSRIAEKAYEKYIKERG
jgi:hypothetical protein